MIRKSFLAIPVLMALATFMLAGAGAAGAADPAHVRLIYLSPDGPHVDFYVDGTKDWSDITYKTVSTYVNLPTGTHDFQVRPAGASATSQPLADVQQNCDAAFYTVFAGGKSSALQAGVFQDGFPNPPAGKAVARFVHMAPEVQGVDVKVVNGPTLFTNISFLQSSPYAPLPPGSYPVQLIGNGGAAPGQSLFSTTAVLSRAGVVYTLIGTGGVGQPVELVQTLDATSAALSPTGGAGTGEGGTAYGGLMPVGLIACWLLATAALLLMARRVARVR